MGVDADDGGAGLGPSTVRGGGLAPDAKGGQPGRITDDGRHLSIYLFISSLSLFFSVSPLSLSHANPIRKSSS